MKSNLLRLVLLALSLVGAPLVVRAQTNQAQPPGQISYQGYLTDANGIPLATNTPQNYNILFNIYAAPTGGTPLWGEAQVVTVNQGFFTVLLGVGNTIPSSANFHTNDLTYLFATNGAQSRYIGITVGGLGTGEIVPRLRLLASPYALLAANAVNVTGSKSISSTNLGPDIGLWSVNGANVYRAGGAVGIGTASPNAPLQVVGTINSTTANNTDGYVSMQPGNTTQAGYFAIFKPGSVRMGYLGWDPANITLNLENGANFYVANGNVGIGASSPGFPLTFAQSLGDKISLWTSSGGNSYGFGIQAGLLQIHADAGADIAFGTGSSASMNENMRLNANGVLRLPGTFRNGSESGTSQGPNQPGLVVRRINSNNSANGQIVAVMGNMQLQRDGTAGGLKVVITAPSGGPVIAGTKVNQSGTVGGVMAMGYGGGVGTYTVCTDAEHICFIHLTLGDPYNVGGMTQVVLSRFGDNSNNSGAWVGTLNSTINQ